MFEIAASEISSPPTQLPEDFVFSQSNLQSYMDCKRRFWLTYMNRVPWPSAPAAPVGEFERLMRLGATFHRMIQRAEEGISNDNTDFDAEFPLSTWFHSYQQHRPSDLPTAFTEVERTLETQIKLENSAHRLMAKYDLIAADPDRTVIMDWKTGSKLTRPAILQQKMQTKVYPYVLVEASEALPWGPIQPEQVEMRYWFVAAPAQPVVFRYDSAQHSSIRELIHRLASEILLQQDRTDFPKVSDTEFTRKYICGFCTYRSYCERGAHASDLIDLDQVAPEDIVDTGTFLDFSLDDVDEIPY